MAAGLFSGVPRWLMGRFGNGTAIAPTSGFTGTPLTGTAPLTVFFTDTSTGTITSEQFDPGDGSGILASVPASHTYVSAGTYSPSLTVFGPGGSDTLTRTDYITVSPPPPPHSELVCGTALVIAAVAGAALVLPALIVEGDAAVIPRVLGTAIIPEC